MALLNSFDYVVRTNNIGKHTDAPLVVRFWTDGVARRRQGESYGYVLCYRYAEKLYRWSGYTLSAAKQIAAFYANGNAQRVGYYRRYKDYAWSDVDGWTFRYNFRNQNQVRVVKVGADMYAVEITIDDVDQFIVDERLLPDDYDGWCAAFASTHVGDEWAAYDSASSTPYKFELFYDEPLTVVG